MIGDKRPIRVLHLASFAGNIGDLANHAGARRMMAQTLSVSLDLTQLEIREFYWKQRHFDSSFVDYANTFDLLLIGGGNYFELWVDNSATGTSIDLKPELFARLTVPTVFFALGVDTGQGYSEKSSRKFSEFVDAILSRDEMFVCVRNDGSRRALREVLGDVIAQKIPVMPDCGFFVDMNSDLKEGGKNKKIGINIAGDMLDRRFDRDLDADGFLKELSGALENLLDSDPEITIDLMPHIWRDSILLARMLPMLPDRHLRRRISVGRLEPTTAGLPDFINRYKAFDLVFGMRFHANVCPLGMAVPSRGLLNYPQIQHLYDEIGSPDRLIDVREHGFGEKIVNAAHSDFSDITRHRVQARQLVTNLQSQARATFSMLDKWLLRNLE